MADNTRYDRNPNYGDLRTKKPTIFSNQARATLMDNREDIVACLNKAREAQEIAALDLERSSNWLNKSQELLAEILVVMAIKDASKETPSCKLDVVVDNVDTNVNVLNPDTNPEQARTRTPKEPPSGATVHNNDVGAKKCRDNANKVFKAGNLDKAKGLFLKAKSTDVCVATRVEQYLKIVHDGGARDVISRENAVPEEDPRELERPEQAHLITDEANTYLLQIAENAFNDDNHERALKFLDEFEASYTSERAVKLRKQVEDALSTPKKSFVESCNRYLINESSSKSSPEGINKTLTEAQNAQMKRLLRTIAKKNKALKTKEDKQEIEERNTEPVDHKESLRNEIQSNVRAEEAKTYINTAEKANYDGKHDEAENPLRKADPTEQAKKMLGTVHTATQEKKILDNEKQKLNDNESARALVEYATETIFPIEVQKLINSGLDNMDKKDYYAAEAVFQKAKNLLPSSKHLDELLTDVQTKIKIAISGTNSQTPESTEEPSTGTQNVQNIAVANTYTNWAESFSNLACSDLERRRSFGNRYDCVLLSFEDRSVDEVEERDDLASPPSAYNYNYECGVLTCTLCGRTFKAKSGYASHMRAHSRRDRESTENTSRGTQNRHNVRVAAADNTYRTHNAFNYNGDNNSSESVSKERRAGNRSTGGRVYDYNYEYGELTCTLCGRTFKAKSGYASHMRAHWRRNEDR